MEWRRERDSNPRYGYPHNGFRDRPVQPLRHLSAVLAMYGSQVARNIDTLCAPCKPGNEFFFQFVDWGCFCPVCLLPGREFTACRRICTTRKAVCRELGEGEEATPWRFGLTGCGLAPITAVNADWRIAVCGNRGDHEGNRRECVGARETKTSGFAAERPDFRLTTRTGRLYCAGSKRFAFSSYVCRSRPAGL